MVRHFNRRKQVSVLYWRACARNTMWAVIGERGWSKITQSALCFVDSGTGKASRQMET